MLIIAFFNFVVVVFAYLAYRHHSELLLKISVFLIFLFLAFRYDFGNDYQNYLENFIAINQGVIVWESEPGWVVLCRLFAPFGFFAMVAFLAAIQSVVYYRFIRKYIPESYYWLAVFLYLFTPAYMLIQSSAMRQSVAMCLFIFSIDFLYKKDAFRYFICIGIASLFHNSAVVLFPLYFLAVLDWGFNKINSIVLFLLFLLLLIFNQYLKPYLDQFVNIYFEKYDTYQIGAELGTGIGVIYSVLVFAFVLYYSRFQVKENVLLFKIAVISYYVIPIGFVLVMIARIGMYLQPALIAVIPIVAISLKKGKERVAFLSVYLLYSLYQFYSFFQSEVWRDAFGKYNVIFFAPQIY